MLNRSCERCRTKKLRCPGGRECEICLTANAECFYKQRKKKVVRKKRSTTANVKAAISPSNNLLSNEFSSSSTYAFSSHIRNRRGGEYQPIVVHPENTPSSSSTHISSFPSSSSGATATTPNSQSLSSYPDSKHSESVGSGKLNNDEVLAILREARSIIGFSLEGCEILLNVTFKFRIYPTIHACIHVDSLIQLFRKFFAQTEDYHGASIRGEPITIDQLTLILLTLSASLLFISHDEQIHAYILKIAKTFSQRLKDNDAVACQKEIYAFADRLVHKRLGDNDYSLEGIQSNIIHVFHHTGDQSTKEQMCDRALRCSLKLGFHRVTGYTLLDEVKVRIWWYLATRNWLAAPSTWVYSIFPSQFSTRMPLNLEYRDLECGLDKNTLLSIRRDWTTASYSLNLIKLASTVRDLVDEYNLFHSSTEIDQESRLRFQSKIVESFDILARSFDWFYRLEKPFDLKDAVRNGMIYFAANRIEIERWMIHQQVFHCFLELHEVESFIDQAVPKTCLTLAHHILDTVHLNAQRCSVLSSSSLPKRGLITAATVVAFHVLNGGKIEESAKEYKEVALATAKAKRLTGEVNLQSLLRLETLLSSWSRYVPDSIDTEVQREIEEWEENDRWVGDPSFSRKQKPTIPTVEIDEKLTTFALPQISSLLPAYQSEIGDSDWEAVWNQFLKADNDFLFPTT